RYITHSFSTVEQSSNMIVFFPSEFSTLLLCTYARSSRMRLVSWKSLHTVRGSRSASHLNYSEVCICILLRPDLRALSFHLSTADAVLLKRSRLLGHWVSNKAHNQGVAVSHSKKGRTV